MAPPFRVGVTRDLLAPDGAGPIADIRLDLLDSGGIEWSFLSDEANELRPYLIDGFDAVRRLPRSGSPRNHDMAVWPQ